MELSDIVALVALVIALASSVTAWRLLLSERRRSAARVAELRAAAGTDLPLHADAPQPTQTPTPSATDAHADSEPTVTIGVSPATDAWSPAPVGLFDTVRRPGLAPSQVVLAVSVAVLVIATAGVAIYSAGRTDDAAVVAATVSVAAEPQALELLALDQQRDGSTLRISGRVRNPMNGAEASGLTVSVSLLGADGAFLGAGRAPVEADTLRPGGDAPFEVAVVRHEGAQRYRVSFLGQGEEILHHVDRRGDPRDGDAP